MRVDYCVYNNYYSLASEMNQLFHKTSRLARRGFLESFFFYSIYFYARVAPSPTLFPFPFTFLHKYRPTLPYKLNS